MNRRDLMKMFPAACFAAGVEKKARLRTAICAYSFREALGKKTMTYDDLVRLAVETETDGLDLTVYWFPSTNNDFLIPLRGLAYKHGVELYSISVRTEMCRATPELRDKEIADVRKWIDVAHTLGAGHIRVFGGTVPKGESEETAAGWVVEILKRAAEYAGAKGVILGLENHGGITSRAERILDIVQRVGSPWVAVNMDTGNFTTDAYRQVEMLVPYAANVQVKTEIRDEKGQRVESDWDRIAAMLARAGYKGYLALEYEAREEPAVAVPRLMKKLNAIARKYSA
jgi:sugar phosphate isomerase/epimerase